MFRTSHLIDWDNAGTNRQIYLRQHSGNFFVGRFALVNKQFSVEMIIEYTTFNDKRIVNHLDNSTG